VNFIHSDFKNEQLGITDIQEHCFTLRIREGICCYEDKDYAIIFNRVLKGEMWLWKYFYMNAFIK